MAISGVTVQSGVVLTAGLEAYARVLRGSVQNTVPLTITSGVRSAEKQAAAMLAKLKSGDDLHELYANDATISKLMASGKNVSTWTRILKEETAKGISISKHLGGGSFDVQTRGLTDDQVGQIKAAIKATGGSYIHESIPPHLHVDVPAKFAVGSALEVAQHRALSVVSKTAHSPYAWGVLGLSALVLGVVIYNRGRRPHGPEITQAQSLPEEGKHAA